MRSRTYQAFDVLSWLDSTTTNMKCFPYKCGARRGFADRIRRSSRLAACLPRTRSESPVLLRRYVACETNVAMRAAQAKRLARGTWAMPMVAGRTSRRRRHVVIAWLVVPARPPQLTARPLCLLGFR